MPSILSLLGRRRLLALAALTALNTATLAAGPTPGATPSPNPTKKATMSNPQVELHIADFGTRIGNSTA